MSFMYISWICVASFASWRPIQLPISFNCRSFVVQLSKPNGKHLAISDIRTCDVQFARPYCWLRHPPPLQEVHSVRHCQYCSLLKRHPIRLCTGLAFGLQDSCWSWLDVQALLRPQCQGTYNLQCISRELHGHRFGMSTGSELMASSLR